MGKKDDGNFYEDINDEIAKNISVYCYELLEDLEPHEQDDVAIEVMISALSAILLVYKIKNSKFTHKQILEDACSRLKQDFFKKAGREDFTIPLEDVN